MIAPGIEPSPPRITIANALTAGTEPMYGSKTRPLTAQSVPAAPARPAPRPNATMSIRSTLIPESIAAFRFWLVARSASPSRVRRSRSQRPIRIAIVTLMMIT